MTFSEQYKEARFGYDKPLSDVEEKLAKLRKSTESSFKRLKLILGMSDGTSETRYFYYRQLTEPENQYLAVWLFAHLSPDDRAELDALNPCSKEFADLWAKLLKKALDKK